MLGDLEVKLESYADCTTGTPVIRGVEVTFDEDLEVRHNELTWHLVYSTFAK